MSGQVISATFRPPWWLAGPHRQTLWGSMRRAPRPLVREERFTLPDGDILRLAWNAAPPPRPGQPLVVLMHGLAGSVESPYLRGIAGVLTARKVPVVAINFRGCGGEPNTMARGYHSGETGDLEALLHALGERYPGCSLRVAGISLGGNVLLCHLGRRGADSPIDRAVAICPPIDLHRCIKRMSSGLSQGYQRYLLRGLKQDASRKVALLRDAGVRVDAVLGAQSFRAFDNALTAPLHGFRDADDYYTQSSSRPLLSAIRVPTTVLFARDDPFMHPSMVPAEEELSPTVRFEVAAAGGHVGFVSGLGQHWLDERVPAALLDDPAPGGGDDKRG